MEPEQRLLTALPSEAILELESLLYEPRFLDVPIGATLKDLLFGVFTVGSRPLGHAAALRARLGWWRFCWRGPRKQEAIPRLETGRVLLTLLADTRRLYELVLPVIAELEPRHCNVIGGGLSIHQKLPPETGFCTRYQMTEVDLRTWRLDYGRCRTAWHKTIRQWLHRHRLPSALFVHLAYALAVRSYCVAGFFQFLDRIQPSAVVADSEHNHPWSSLVLTARQRGIPTVQMIHGVLDPPYTAVPLLSDVALCWGEQQREQMIELGTDPGRLVVTGCQRLTRTMRPDSRAVRARLGLPAEGPIIMLATNPRPREEWRKLFFAFGEAFQDHPGLAAVVRLHASEKENEHREECARYPALRVLENQAWTVEDAMAACDVVVIHNSGLGNDALVLGRLVVLLDVLAAPLGNGQMLADRAGSPVARTAAELRQVVDRIFAEPNYRRQLHSQAEAYVGWFCSAFDQDAARNVAAEVRKRARP